MPSSSFAGKYEIITNVFQMREVGVIDNGGQIVDVGPGLGTYYHFLAHNMPGYFWIAVEIFGPYVEKYNLNMLYDQIVVDDFKNFSYNCAEQTQITFLGDVVEHMSEEDALSNIDKARNNSKLTVVSVPLGEWPQGEVNGNKYEAHISGWTDDKIRDLVGEPNCFSFVGDNIGVYAYV